MTVPMRSIEIAALTPDGRSEILERSPVPDVDFRQAAAGIVDVVRRGGDRALDDANRRYGGARPSAVRVDTGELFDALETLDPDVRAALGRAADNIKTCHELQRPVDAPLEVVPGVTVDRRWAPLDRVGVYVPGGRAAYPSTLLMAVIPARVAGVDEIVVVSPADEDGNVSSVLLAAAALLGIEEVHIAGGAQAVAAMAYGTETIRRVDKIVGPGNAWVTAAKLAVFGDVAIDLPAGPSEALVIADEASFARFVAADLLCQAEHGPRLSRRARDDVTGHGRRRDGCD